MSTPDLPDAGTALRSRLFLLPVLVLVVFVWTIRAEDSPQNPPEFVPESGWDLQIQILLDRPLLPDFAPDGKASPAPGMPALVLVLRQGPVGERLLADLAEIARKTGQAEVFWAAPDENTAKSAQDLKSGIAGAASQSVVALVPEQLRPALLVTGPDRRVSFAHLKSFALELPDIAMEISSLLSEKSGKRMEMPKPLEAGFQGAMKCAACHRSQFVDWLLTPHSHAWSALEKIGRDADENCVGCHVAGWNQPGGFAKAPADRRLADVQCETCHVPARIHTAGNRMKRDEFEARCRDCHTPSASLVNFAELVPWMSHPSAKTSEKRTMQDRERALTEFRNRTYFQFCSKTRYVGSAACKPCHASAHVQWAESRHQGAFQTLRKAGKDAEAACVRCHTTGVGHDGGFQDEKSTPGMAEVGCEACHGPGKLHLEAVSREERLASIFRFDEKCPLCVVNRICATCHDKTNDPDFRIGRDLERVKHREK